MGLSADEPKKGLSDEAKQTMLDVLGVDLRSLVFRGKFVFVAQVGSPQKVTFEVKDASAPPDVSMDVLITVGRCQQHVRM